MEASEAAVAPGGVHLTVRINQRTARLLDEAAKARGVTRSEVVRRGAVMFAREAVLESVISTPPGDDD